METIRALPYGRQNCLIYRAFLVSGRQAVMPANRLCVGGFVGGAGFGDSGARHMSTTYAARTAQTTSERIRCSGTTCTSSR